MTITIREYLWRNRSAITFIGTWTVALTLLGFNLQGCSQPGATSTTVAGTEIALTAAEKAATLYVSLPQCGPTHPKPICSEATLNAQIKASDNVAFAAVMAARSGGDSATVASANAAVAALVALIPVVTGR